MAYPFAMTPLSTDKFNENSHFFSDLQPPAVNADQEGVVREKKTATIGMFALKAAAYTVFGSALFALTAVVVGTMSAGAGGIAGGVIGAGYAVNLLIDDVASRILSKETLEKKSVKLAINLLKVGIQIGLQVAALAMIVQVFGIALTYTGFMLFSLKAVGIALAIGAALFILFIIANAVHRRVCGFNIRDRFNPEFDRKNLNNTPSAALQSETN